MMSRLFITGLIAILASGCATTMKSLMYEEVVLPPGEFFNTDLEAEMDGTYIEYFGVNPEVYYRSIYDAFKILRVSLLSAGDDYIFEIQTDGDIELAKRKYGKSMQFNIFIWDLNLHIFTTATMDEAVLVSGDKGIVTVQLDKNSKVLSARQKSNYRVEARLKLEINREHLRVYLPKKLLPERSQKWWSQEYGSFVWLVRSCVALPPLWPIPTNLPDVFFLPYVHSVLGNPRGGSVVLPGISWDFEKVSKNNK